MAERYKVTTTGQSDRPSVTRRQITYPADAKSLALSEAAGGLSKLSAEERERLRFKTVEAGEYCDDMPEHSKAIYLARGWIERIPASDEATQAKLPVRSPRVGAADKE